MHFVCRAAWILLAGAKDNDMADLGLRDLWKFMWKMDGGKGGGELEGRETQGGSRWKAKAPEYGPRLGW